MIEIDGMLGKGIEISQMEALFLLALHNSQNELSLSGSEIIKKLIVSLGEEWSPAPGTTYKIVKSLKEKGYIQETTEIQERKDQRIRTYSLTAKGKLYIPKVTSRVQKVFVFMLTTDPECCKGIKIVDDTIREESD